MDRNMTATGHEYYDGPGNRATLQMFKDNALFSLIFDYENNQLFYVHSCKCTKIITTIFWSLVRLTLCERAAFLATTVLVRFLAVKYNKTLHKDHLNIKTALLSVPL